MLPKIKRVEFRNIHINDEIYSDNDIFLHTKGMEALEPAHEISMKDFEKMLLHGPDAAVFGLGFKGRMKVHASIIDAAKKHKIDLHVLPTPEAAKKFQELARKGRNVVAKLHITC